jgi:hypothetical protein
MYDLRASAGGEHPTDRCASADSDKTQECHVRISGQQVKHKAGKRRKSGQSKETFEEIGHERHRMVSDSGGACDIRAGVTA